MADDNSTFGQLVQASGQVTAPTSEGIQQGVALAHTFQDMQRKQQESQVMQQKLDDMKWSSAKGLMQNYIRAAPEVQKAMFPMVEKRFTTMGFDPLIAHALKAPEYQKMVMQSLHAMDQDPNAAATGIQALQSYEAFNDGAQGLSQMIEQRSKQATSERMQQAAMSNKLQMNQNTNATRLESAQMVGGPRHENMLRNEANRFHNDSRIKKFSDQIDMIDNVKGILYKPLVTNQEFNDAQIEISNAIAGARGAALGKLERTEYDTYQQDLAKIAQKVFGKPQDAVPKAIMEQFNKLVEHTQKSFLKSRAQRAKGLLRTSDNEDVMKTQHEAMQPYLTEDVEGHGNEVDVSGKDMTVTPHPASGADVYGANYKTKGASDLSANQQSYVDKLQKAGLTPEQAQQRMQQKGIK